EIRPPMLISGGAAALPAAAVNADHHRYLGDALGQVEVAGQLHAVVLDVFDVGAGCDLVLLRSGCCGHQRCERNQKPDSHGFSPGLSDFAAMVARPAGVVRTIDPMIGNIPARTISPGRWPPHRNNADLAAGPYIGWHNLAVSPYGPDPPGGSRPG